MINSSERDRFAAVQLYHANNNEGLAEMVVGDTIRSLHRDPGVDMIRHLNQAVEILEGEEGDKFAEATLFEYLNPGAIFRLATTEAFNRSRASVGGFREAITSKIKGFLALPPEKQAEFTQRPSTP